MPTPSKILPFPADEIRSAAQDHLVHASMELARLLRFFRGHHKSTQVLESLTMRVLSIQLSLEALGWDYTNAEPPFPDVTSSSSHPLQPVPTPPESQCDAPAIDPPANPPA